MSVGALAEGRPKIEGPAGTRPPVRRRLVEARRQAVDGEALDRTLGRFAGFAENDHGRDLSFQELPAMSGLVTLMRTVCRYEVYSGIIDGRCRHRSIHASVAKWPRRCGGCA